MLERSAPGRRQRRHSPAVEAASQRLDVNLQALATAIAERSATARQASRRSSTPCTKSHARIGDKLTPIVDDSYFDVVMTAEDVGKTARQDREVAGQRRAASSCRRSSKSARRRTSSPACSRPARSQVPAILALLEDRFTPPRAASEKQPRQASRRGPSSTVQGAQVGALVRLADFKASAERREASIGTAAQGVPRA